MTLAAFRQATADLPDSTPIYLADSFGDVEPADHLFTPGETSAFGDIPAIRDHAIILVAQ
jgi:hypothetical protein